MQFFKNMKDHILITIILALVIGCLYAPLRNAGYVWDDTLLFVNRTGLRDSAFSWGLFSEPVLPGTSYFRPFIFFTWYLEFHIFGQDPKISHIIGLVVFYINSLLLYAVAYCSAIKLDKIKPIYYGLSASLLYILHPSLIESTAWVSGRFDQYCTLFVLLGILIFICNFKNTNQPIKKIAILAISLCFLMALFSKELGLVFPLILLCFYFSLAFHLESEKKYIELIKLVCIKQLALIISLAIIFACYMFLRIQAMQGVYHSDLTESYFKQIIFEKLLPLHAIKYYVLQVIFPFTHIDLLQPLEEVQQSFISKMTSVLISLLVCCALGYAIIKKTSFSAWMFVSAFISVFLVLYFIPIALSMNLGHDRFLTLPMAFICLSVVFIPYKNIINFIPLRVSVLKFIASLCIFSWLALCVLTVRSVVPFWLNEYSLWTWAYKNHPNSALARYNYLYSAVTVRKYDEVIRVCQQYMKKHGGLEVADQSIYANALMNKNDPESLNYYEGVMYALPKFHEMHDKDARKKADNFLMTAAQIGDTYSTYAIGLIIFKGDLDKAMHNLEISKWYMLSDQQDLLNYYMAALLYAQGHKEQALNIYQMQKEKTLKLGEGTYILTKSILSTYCKNNKIIRNEKSCSDFQKQKEFQ